MASTRANVLESPLYRALQRFANAVLLSAAWVLASVPLVTIGPATAAMFAVVRQWDRGTDEPVLRSFVHYFRENLRHGLVVGIGGLAVAVLLIVDLAIAGAVPPPVGPTLAVLAAITAVVAAAMAIYLFPLMITYELRPGRLLRLSLIFAIGRPATTVGCLVLVGLFTALTYVFPMAPLLAASVIATTVYHWTTRAIAGVASLSGAASA